jgi:predicted phage-related endonuclease
MGPTELWGIKTGLIEPTQKMTRQMAFGQKLEAVVAAEYRARHPEIKTSNPGKYAIQRHGEYPFLFATLDRRIEQDGTPGVLEVKTTSERMASAWDVEPPLHVQAQVQHQLMVTGYSWGVVAVLIGGSDYREFAVEPNPRFLSVLLMRELEFWLAVESKTPPKERPSVDLAEALERLHPDDSGAVIDLGPEVLAIDAELVSVQATLSELEKKKKDLQAEIQCRLAGATYGKLPDGTVWSWKTQERGEYVAKASKYRVLRRKGVK